MKHYLGIDPGYSGAVAVIDSDGSVVLLTPTPATLGDLSDLMYEAHTFNPVWSLIERVHSMPAQGVASSFKFGRSFGQYEAMLSALRFRYGYITPVKWQKPLSLLRLTKEETVTEKKNRHKALAQQLFPHADITHKTADALLIAETARRER